MIILHNKILKHNENQSLKRIISFEFFFNLSIPHRNDERPQWRELIAKRALKGMKNRNSKNIPDFEERESQ